MVRLVVCLAIVSGCVPYVLPPIRGQAGVIDTGAAGSRAGLHAEIGAAPLQLIHDQMDRRWDATIPGSFDHTDRTAWGAAIAAGPVVGQWTSHEVTRRVLVEGVGRWTTEGRAGGLRGTYEWSTFVDGSATDSYGFGEAAFGFYVEAGAWDLPDGSSWMVTAGISLRSPLLAGLACCLE
jgi:hypothetical protein